MSHVRCVMCGKDSAKSTFDPSKLARDIYVRQSIGKGYPGGWEYGPDVSVLGDEEFTPKIFDRSLDLIRLFIEKEIISPKDVMIELKFGYNIPYTDMFATYEDMYYSAEKEKELLTKKISELEKSKSSKSSTSYYDQFYENKNKYEKIEKKLAMEKKVDKILIWLHNNLESEIINKDNWILYIKEYGHKIAIELCKKIYKLNREERAMLESRIKTYDIRYICYFISLRNEPTIHSETEAYMKNPKDIYYPLHGLPLPQDLNLDYGKPYFL